MASTSKKCDALPCLSTRMGCHFHCEQLNEVGPLVFVCAFLLDMSGTTKLASGLSAQLPVKDISTYPGP